MLAFISSLVPNLMPPNENTLTCLASATQWGRLHSQHHHAKCHGIRYWGGGGHTFLNTKDTTAIRTKLTKMRHPQPATPIQTDNQCIAGILNHTIKQRQSKEMGMHFYWMQDQVQQEQFHIIWWCKSENLVDYFTKHHPPFYHCLMHKKFLFTK